jgi:hypothetical protein
MRKSEEFEEKIDQRKDSYYDRRKRRGLQYAQPNEFVASSVRTYR